ncbi:MAG: glycoside hydrolase family 125 protein, partial [Bacillota bacterium]|nr:glycoside hydrolase family 125 protein [Bacillota bacterium]
GLIEFRGDTDPFIKPILNINGAKYQGELTWSKEQGWIPRFTGSFNKVLWEGIILTPENERGAFYRLKVINNSSQEIDIKLGWQITWANTLQLIYNDHLLGCQNRVEHSTWTNTLGFEARGQTGLAALAFYLKDELFNQVKFDIKELTNGAGCHQVFIGTAGTVKPGEARQIDLTMGLSVEIDGAHVTAIHMRRLGFNRCHAGTLGWLSKKSETVSASVVNAAKKAGELFRESYDTGKLPSVVLKNLFFNYFYSNSKTIDSGDLVMLTSRSSRYYVSGAFWARDAFLWSFPAILMIDKEKALELLRAGFTKYAENGPFHSCYIDGALLYPGFELDELAAFFIALESYDQLYEDLPWQEPWILEGARVLEKTLWQHHNPKHYLFSTMLDPSDDQVEYPYLTYSNVLTWRAIQVLQRIYKSHNHNTHVRHLDGAERLLKKAINQHCIFHGPFGSMYVWAADGEKGYQLYDNPPGSLQLLPHYGFCTMKDKIWLNTVKWIYSEHNPYAYLDTPIKGIGGVHAPYPWVLGACNSLLAGKVQEGLELLLKSEMDNGYACETVKTTSGQLNTGAAFAPCGGFLAYSLVQAFK